MSKGACSGRCRPHHACLSACDERHHIGTMGPRPAILGCCYQAKWACESHSRKDTGASCAGWRQCGSRSLSTPRSAISMALVLPPDSRGVPKERGLPERRTVPSAKRALITHRFASRTRGVSWTFESGRPHKHQSKRKGLGPLGRKRSRLQDEHGGPPSTASRSASSAKTRSL